MTVHIKVIDVNDNRPEFLTQENPVEISVSSYLETGEVIAKMEAWDSGKIRSSNLTQTHSSEENLDMDLK